MRTRIAAVVLCLTLALTLVGCVHADRAVTLNNDGTGIYTFSVGISAQMIDLGGSGLTDSMNAFGEQVKKAGGSYSRSDADGYSTWKYVRPFTSVQQLDGFLSESPQSDASKGADPNVAGSVHVTESSDFFRTTFHVSGQMSLVIPNADQSTADLLKDARESFAVTMPGWVSAQTGGVLSGNTVTYTVHYGEAATINVTGGGYILLHIALVTGGALLALVLVVVGLMLLLRGKRRQDKPLPAFTGSTSPYYAPTNPGASGAEQPTYPAMPDYSSAPPDAPTVQ
jgi:hypothetical protein